MKTQSLINFVLVAGVVTMATIQWNSTSSTTASVPARSRSIT